MIGQFVVKVISYWLTANNRKLINFLSTQFFNLRKCIESIFEEHYNWNDSKRRSDICPVQSLLDYFSRRALSDGPLFRTYDGHAVSRKLFTDYLALIFRVCGLDPTKYKEHSFRIGAATFAAECGFSDAQIRSMGRWKSDAYRKYIRGPGLCSTA